MNPNIPFRLKFNIDVNELVIIIDVSASMGNIIIELKKLLISAEKLLYILGINKFTLIKFSDYDSKSICNGGVLKVYSNCSAIDLIKLLQLTNAGELGSGGSSREAHTTALSILQYNMNDLNKVGVILISDEKHHDNNDFNTDAIKEREYLSSVTLPNVWNKLNFDKFNIQNINRYDISNCTTYPINKFIESFCISIMNLIEDNLLTIKLINKYSSLEEKIEYFNSCMTLYRLNPNLIIHLGKISIAFYIALNSLNDSYKNEWSNFCSSLSSSLRDSLEHFKEQSVLNIDEVYEEFSHIYDNPTNYVYTTSCLINPSIIKNIFINFKINENMDIFINSLKFIKLIKCSYEKTSIELSPNYLPVEHLTLSSLISFITGWKTMFQKNLLQIIASFIISKKSEFIDELYNISITYLENNKINISNNSNTWNDIPKWWSSEYGIRMLIVINKIFKWVEEDVLTSRLNNLIFNNLLKNNDIQYKCKIISNEDIIVLKKCSAGKYIPENLIINDKCVYCTYTHDNINDDNNEPNIHEGKLYHNDGTINIIPTIHIDDNTGLILDSSRLRVCSNCTCKYYIYDRRGINNISKNKCYNCRSGLKYNIKVPVIECEKCRKLYVNGSPICGNCKYSEYRYIICKYTFKNLYDVIPNEINNVFRNNTFVNDIINNSKNKIQFINIDEILKTFKDMLKYGTSNKEQCVIGTCSKPVMLYSPCGNCEFKICIKCMNMHYKINYKKVYTLNKFKCLCTNNISSDTLTLLSKSYIRLYEYIKDLKEDSNKNQYGFCIDCKDIIIKHSNNECNNDFDDSSVRCISCSKKYSDYLKNILDVDSIESVTNLIKCGSFKKNTLFRKSPCCGKYFHRNDNSCAHMKCICGLHWCWTCKEGFNTSNECYDHMGLYDDDNFDVSFHPNHNIMATDRHIQFSDDIVV